MNTGKTWFTFINRPARFAIPFFFSVFLLVAKDVLPQNFWQPTNGPNKTDLRALAINSSGHIFAASYGGGIFRSMDNGNSWIAVNNGLTNMNVQALAIYSVNIFAGTDGGGIFRSMDNGASWTAVNSGLTDFKVAALAINSSGHIFAGTSRQVFRSIDNGASWTNVFSGFSTVGALAINSSGHIFAGTNGGGVYRSMDNGAIWTNVFTSFNPVVALAINSSEHIFAGTNGGGVYRSTANGNSNSWAAVNSGLTDLRVVALAINSSGDIFAGTNGSGVYRSTTNGDISWTPLNSGLTDIKVGALAINSSGYIFAGTFGGFVFRSVQSTVVGVAPSVTTNTATNVSLTSATLKGTVNPNGLITTVKFQYGTTTSYGTDVTAIPSPVTGTTPVSVSAALVGLSPNTLYHYWAVGTNNAGTTTGVDQTFTTTASGSAPTVTTNVATNVSNTSATLNGTVNPNSLSTTVTFDYGTTMSYGSVITATQSPVSGAIEISVSAQLTGLLPNVQYNYRVIGMNSAGNTNGTNQTFTTSNRPPVVASTISNQTLTVDGPFFTRNLNASPAVFSDPDGDALSYTVSSNSPATASAGISGSALTVSPIATGSTIITVTANDGRGGTQSTAFTVTVNSRTYPSTLPLNTIVSFQSRTNASDYPATDYRIVGLPGASNQSVSGFLSISGQNKDWQVYWDNGAVSNFFIVFDGSSNFRFSIGRAFWIIKKGSLSFNTTVPSAPLNTAQEIELPLPNSSWNLITNPFTTAVAWSKIQAANNVTEPIYAFSGSFSAATSFDPYSGYYFYNATNLMKLKIPYSVYFSSTPEANADLAIWRVNISFSSGEISDQSASFGIANEASSGLDHFDFRKPRALAATPTVEFKRPKWDANYSTFATDIRPEFETSESWEFDVRAISRQPAQLAFAGVSKIPSRFEVYLLDADHAQSANLREDSLYQFTPAAELMKFKVVVGRKENVQEQLNALALPKDFVLGPNYPNPFNPTTTIPIAIPAAAEIKLKIYNLLGAEVKTLYDGAIAAGRYWFNWDGRNELGNQVATGVYLYRLTTSKGVSLLGKMILMR